MSNGQSSPVEVPLCEALESEAVLRWLIDYDEALAAGLTDRKVDDRTLQNLDPAARQEVADLCDFLEVLNDARNLDAISSRQFPAPHAESSQSDRLVANRLGQFRIVRELGRGGHGIVFLAHDPTLNRKVAIKIPRPETLISKNARRRFIAEGRAIASLNHPHILKVFEAGETGAICYIASEFCAGPSLEQWLGEQGRSMNPREAARVVADLAEAVEHAHSHGILHRDLKPSNVLLQPTNEPRTAALVRASTVKNEGPRTGDQRPKSGLEDEQSIADKHKLSRSSAPDFAQTEFPFIVKLSDFGIAKLFDETDEHSRTITGTILGTVPYMSPEQATGNSRIGLTSDVYALGAILYELITGKFVFQGESRAALIQRIIADEPVPLRSVRKEVPRDLEAICLKCLEKEPGQRYPTAGDLRDDLQAFLAGIPVHARPLTTPRRLLRWSRRKPAAAALLLVVTVSCVALALGGWWTSYRLRQEIQTTQKERDRANKGEAEARRQRGEAERERVAIAVREKRLRRDVFCLDAHSAYRAITGGRPELAAELLQKYAQDPQIASTFVFRFVSRLGHLAERVWSEPRMECNSVAFSPDGTRLAAGFENGTTPVWDLETGREVLRLRGHTSCVNTVRFTPDGARMITASCDGTVRLWDAASGRMTRLLQQQKEAILSLAVSRDGLLAASGDEKGKVTLFRLPDGKLLTTAMIGRGRVDDLAFSTDANWLGVAAGYQVYMCRTSPKLISWSEASEPERGKFMHTLGFGPLESMVAWAGDTATVHLGGPELTARRASDLSCRGTVLTLSFSRDGRRLICAGSSQIVEVWDVEARKRISEFYGHVNRITHVAFSPDERRLASAGREGTVRLWSMEKSVESIGLASVLGADKLEFAADGSLLIIGGGGKVRALATTGWHEQFSDDAEHFAVAAGKGDFLATYQDGAGVVRNVRNKSKSGCFQIDAKDSKVSDLVLSADGQTIIAAAGWQLKLWHPQAPGPPRIIGQLPGTYASVGISPSEPSFVCSHAAYPFLVFQGEYSGPVRRRMDARGPTGVVKQLRYNVDGSLFAGASPDGSVYVWDAATNQLKASLIGHEQPVNCVAFCPDGKTLASGDEAGIVRLWDLESGHEALHLKAHAQSVKSIAFSPDAQLMATSTACLPDKSGEVRIWFADRRINALERPSAARLVSK